MDFQGIDHVVFTVHDIEVTCEFYSRALGMEVITFDEGRKALQVGQCKINLHQAGREFEPKAMRPAPGTQDICLITSTPIQGVIEQLRHAGVEIIEGLRYREQEQWGTSNPSIYVIQTATSSKWPGTSTVEATLLLSWAQPTLVVVPVMSPLKSIPVSNP
jgi:catechol 2,3-dioxygenase-like lactoylglutathione lyase family enzyme